MRELTERLDRLIEVLGGGASTSSAGQAPGRAGPSLRHDEVNYFLGASAFEDVVFEALWANDDVGLMWYLT